MRRVTIVRSILLTVLFLCLSDWPAVAKERLQYASSAQVYEAFGREVLVVFQRNTGIEVETRISSSLKALQRLEHDFADIASTSRRILHNRMEQGYVAIPFCKDPLAIITNAQCPVDNITENQLQEIFSGDISNWKGVGGPDQSIVRIVPDKETTANKNFRRHVMKYKDMTYDILTYLSTDTIVVTEKLPWAISFIARGAVHGKQGIQVMRIDGRLPDNPGYPYFQVFYLVTKRTPIGPVEALVDFVFSADGKAIIKKRGMIPIERTP